MVKFASLVCVAVLALGLSGCTSDPAPEPDAGSAGPSATDQAADPLPTPIPSEEPAVVSTWRPEDFPCHPVEGRALDWVEQLYNPSDVAMVEVALSAATACLDGDA